MKLQTSKNLKRATKQSIQGKIYKGIVHDPTHKSSFSLGSQSTVLRSNSEGVMAVGSQNYLEKQLKASKMLT